MKALSIQQPWAYCITHGTKRVENRSWYTSYRGPLLIHAAKTFQTGMEYDINVDSPEMDVYAMQQSYRGGIVGICHLANCISPKRPELVARDQRIWSDPEQFKFVLCEVRAFANPIPYRGFQKIFDIPDDVVAEALAM